MFMFGNTHYRNININFTLYWYGDKHITERIRTQLVQITGRPTQLSESVQFFEGEQRIKNSITQLLESISIPQNKLRDFSKI